MIKKFPQTIKVVVLIFAVNIVFVLAYGCLSVAKDEEAPNELGKKLFKNCSGCHLNGQNLIKEDKPIIGSEKLRKKESFKKFISEPHPPMPNFKKLADDEGKLDALYKFVKTLMAKDS